jgi:hypothetical protein
MPFLTVSWTAPYSIGLMPVDAGEVFDTSLAVPWTPKQSTYVLPYDPTDLGVLAGGNDPVPEPGTPPAPAPDGVGGGGAGAPAPAPAPGVLRPAAPAAVRAQARINPANFRARGVRVRIALKEPARVTVHLEATMKQRRTTRRATTVKRRLTVQRTLKLKSGTTMLRLAPTATGRRVITRSARVRSTLVVQQRYADGRKVTTRRTVTIAGSPDKKATKSN